jgi:hypothetical protein
MTINSIISNDLSIGQVFQDFYRVPDYQREYVWGEPDAKGERGDEVEQFLKDIHSEFEQATEQSAPEYFIGTVVVCQGQDEVFDLIDGQQRTTTSFLTLCALRDLLGERGEEVPQTLKTQISASSTDWQGQTVERMRLDLQYEDASGVLVEYGEGSGLEARREGTRSIRNLANAYDAIREFLSVNFPEAGNGLRRFHGYFTNKVKLIRIQTPNVSRALKIFETINDRGVGLDAMDLLKNLLFMSARAGDFSRLKDIWKALTQEIYSAGEKPLRFLRYYIMATFDVDVKLREEEIYDWLGRHEAESGHARNPIGFAEKLKEAAEAYRNFTLSQNPGGGVENGLVNTRALGGSAVKQHYVLLLAGRHLPAPLFRRLACRIEETMFLWLIAGVSAKDYERLIAHAARRLRSITDEEDFGTFESDFFEAQKGEHRAAFITRLNGLHTYDLRKFRLRYLLAKVTRHFDVLAYGEEGREGLGHYLETRNDIEHILAEQADEEARGEFGDGAQDYELIQRLGNLMLVELSVNRVIKNRPYSVKAPVYAQSQFLVARCQATPLAVGSNDRITRAIRGLEPAPAWDRPAIEQRQQWWANVALDVWHLRPMAATVAGGAVEAVRAAPDAAT